MQRAPPLSGAARQVNRADPAHARI